MKTAVVLICYNQEEYILQALNGILSQSVTPDEVVIADDCSTDRTQQLILDFVAENSLNNWLLLFSRTNLGINRNLQNGIDHTNAEILMIMSGDDISLPNRCQVALDIFTQYPNMHVIATSINKIDSKGNYIGDLKYNDEVVADVEKVIVAGMPNVFPVGQNWKRSVIEKFGKLPHTVPNEDDQITFRAILDGGIFCSSIKTVAYRVHDSSASSWLRNNQPDEEYYERYIQDMSIRKKHMEHWMDAIDIIDRADKNKLKYLLDLKIYVYDFFKDLHHYNAIERIHCLYKCWPAVGLREKYYLIFGKFGVLSWRRVKRLVGK